MSSFPVLVPKMRLVVRLDTTGVSFACSVGASSIHRVCVKNSQTWPEGTGTSLHYTIGMFAPDSLHWTKHCEKKRSGERNRAHACRLCCKKVDTLVNSASIRDKNRSFIHEEPESVQMASFRSRDHSAVCPVVPALLSQLP